MPLLLIVFGFNLEGRSLALAAIVVLVVALADALWLRRHPR
jgi:hypothetical protein